ncbi:MAG TPA: signal peptide peptidase SppA [Pyrinomonadaceae bacterium]|nr:signal peptide peptidase SppA [Pyrinomonadaceae bacterium]HMP66537.1 signal peptide peptidase SppA [Pyrinomonadaceae bacterium]
MAKSKTAKWILIIGGLLFVFLIAAVVGLVLVADRLGQPSVPNNSVLVLSITGDLPDYVPEDPLARALGITESQSFTGLLTQLRKAKVDDRIGAVLLNINFPSIGWGKADELRDAIKDLRTSGKPVYAYMQMGMNRDYYIATAAEKIFLPPPGDLWINGFAAEAMFYRGSLDKLGIEPDVIQIGPKYKNAPDQYTRKDMGEGQREVINAVLDEYFSRFSAAVAEARGKSADDVAGIVDNAPYAAPQAKELGLIDDALYPDQVHEELKKRLGYREDEKLRTIGGGKYREVSSDSLGLNRGDRIAVIFASGAINVGRSSDGIFGGQMVGSDTVVSAINDAAEDTGVKAIILRIDSPGGSALASDLMWHAIENAKAKKPIVVSMSDVAASGGYYIAANANKIVAEPSTITGSIGVFVGKPVLKGFYDWLGISNEYVMRGKNAGIFRATEKWTPEERQKMEEQTNKIYFDNFLPKVAEGRKISVERANELGQGRVWTGTQAKENGLIDEFGGLEKAIDIAKELAEIPADKEVRRVVFPAPRPLFETLFGSGESTLSADMKAQKALAEALPEDARRALRFAELFDRMRNGESMMMMPFELRVK